eukprot:2382881-Prymnesium_polylepis.1
MGSGRAGERCVRMCACAHLDVGDDLAREDISPSRGHEDAGREDAQLHGGRARVVGDARVVEHALALGAGIDLRVLRTQWGGAHA